MPDAVPGSGGLARQQDLELRERPALIVVDGLVFAVIEPLRDVGRREGRAAGGLRRDRERLRAGDERGVGREATRWRRWR